MDIYFDNAASAPVCESAANEMRDVLERIYGNPSAGHRQGRLAAERLKRAAESAAALMGVSEEDIVFTSGGTESNNLAIFGAAKRPGMRIITSKAEHPSVLDCFKSLSDKGFDAVYLTPGEHGRIDPGELSGAINDKTVLVSLMHINHETGVVSDLETLGRVIKEKNSYTLFHADAVQSYGKHTVNAKRWQADLVSVSAHKLHGPKGAGALYVRDGLRNTLRPMLCGGGQQNGLRPGTENLAGICAFAAAADEAATRMDSDWAAVSAIKNRLLDIPHLIDGAVINGSVDDSSPYITNISFTGIPSETLQNALDSLGVYVSAGAACNSRKKAAENVPFSYGLGRERADSAIRISLGRQNTMDEAERFIEILLDIIPKLKITKKKRQR